jgi:site-specific DNA recombinase
MDDRIDRVALYLRVSSEEQRVKEPIKTQSGFLANYVSLYELDVVETYSDDGVPGTVPLQDRPAGRRLLQDAREGRFDTVLVYRLERIGRKLIVMFDAHDRLQAAGVALKSATEPIDTASPAGRLIFQTLGSFAEFERASITERSRDGLHRAFEDGRHVGCIPFGYDIDEHGQSVIVEDEAEIVRQIIEDVAAGVSLYAVAKRLNNAGVPSPGTKYRGRRRRHGASRAHSTVRGIVHQNAYSGTHAVKTHSGPVRRSVPAIVEPELQQRTQAQLATNRQYGGGKPGRNYLLIGLVACDECGTSYSGDASRSKSGTYYYYYSCRQERCGYARRETKLTCPRVSASWLEDLVWTDVRRFLEEPGEVLQRARESLERESEGGKALPPGVRTYAPSGGHTSGKKPQHQTLRARADRRRRVRGAAN